MSIAAVLLAAGGGTRFRGNGHKLLADFRGRPLVTWAIQAAAGAALDEVAVVVGAVDLGPVLPVGLTVIENAEWSSGQATSLQAAVRWARQRRHDVIVVGLGDLPLVPSSAWAAVAATPSPVAVATFDGRRRPPVRLEESVWAILPTTGDEGARVLMKARPDLVLEVPCEGQPVDIDSEEDLKRWS
ncbi:MAG: NTP transferase domain-containing protein [Acidimicrobiales bacterium]